MLNVGRKYVDDFLQRLSGIPKLQTEVSTVLFVFQIEDIRNKEQTIKTQPAADLKGELLVS